MTIALGILTPDGVVIAADTQESWGYFGGAKIGGYKILSRIVEGEHRAFAASGAGAAGYLDSLNQELADNFIDVTVASEMERRFKEKLRKFWAAHMLPMHVPEEQQPTVILGTSSQGVKPQLWANQGSTLFRCKHFTAAGAGRAHASMLLSRLLPGKYATTIEHAAFLAAYVIFQVKDYVEGCGMGTHVTVLHNGNAQYVSDDTIQALEYHFANQLGWTPLPSIS